MLAWIRSLPIGLSLLLCAGCGWKQCLSCCCRPFAATSLACREIEPLPIVPDLSLLPPEMPPSPDSRYCALEELEAQCLAAKNSSQAALLAKEADAVASQKKCFADGSELAHDLLLLQATHERNKSAGVALEIFFRLVEAEAGAQNLDRRLQELRDMLSDVEQLQNRGMNAPVSRSELEIRRLELVHRQVELQGTIEKLNYQLAEAMGVALLPGTHYWPETDLLVEPEVPDADTAVQIGLANRADLAALRRASRAEGREAVAAARLLLGPLGVGAATAGSSHCLKLFQLCAARSESDAREDQLDLARRHQEQVVESEVRQAVDQVRTRLAQITLTRDRRQAIQTRLDSARRQQELAPSPMNSRTIQLEGLAADQDLLHDVVEWKLAVTRLKQAQGLLASECGWSTYR